MLFFKLKSNQSFHNTTRYRASIVNSIRYVSYDV